MPEGGSQHTRSVEGLSVGNTWSGSALVSGFSARDESSAFILGWDTPPMVANWSYYKRGWRNGTSTTTDPVWMDLDHVPPSRIASNQLEDRAAAVWASKQILKRREAELDADVARRDAVLAHRARARGRLHDTHLIRHASQESLVTTNYCYSLPTTYSHYPLPNTYYLLPTTHYLLPTTHYPLPTTHHLLPTTGDPPRLHGTSLELGRRRPAAPRRPGLPRLSKLLRLTRGYGVTRGCGVPRGCLAAYAAQRGATLLEPLGEESELGATGGEPMDR